MEGQVCSGGPGELTVKNGVISFTSDCKNIYNPYNLKRHIDNLKVSFVPGDEGFQFCTNHEAEDKEEPECGYGKAVFQGVNLYDGRVELEFSNGDMRKCISFDTTDSITDIADIFNKVVADFNGQSKEKALFDYFHIGLRYSCLGVCYEVTEHLENCIWVTSNVCGASLPRRIDIPMMKEMRRSIEPEGSHCHLL